MISLTKYAVRNYLQSSASDSLACMITLTSASVVDGEVFQVALDRFVHRLKRYLNKKDLKYVCLRELQRRGVFHYHLVLLDVLFIPFADLDKMWSLGYVWLSSRSGKDAVGYLLKYLYKTNIVEDETGYVLLKSRLHASYSFLKEYKEEYVAIKKNNSFLWYWRKFLNLNYSLGINVVFFYSALWYKFLKFLSYMPLKDASNSFVLEKELFSLMGIDKV